MNYTIKIEQLKPNNEEETNQIESKYIAIEVNEGQKEILGDYTKGRSTYEGEEYESIEAREIVKGTLKGEESRNYAIKLWMDENVTLEDNVVNKKFIGKVVVDGNLNELAEYNEPILHGTDPVLKEELVPVVIDDTGNVTKANTKEEWYNYEEKRWANAVILANNKTAESYQDNQEIPEEDIESYFVWIPRYNYKLFDMGEYTSVTDAITNKGPTTAIQIRFGTSDTTDTKKECATPKVSGESGDCAVGKWMTHPAFLAFENTKGLWVGKFETGYNQSEDGSLKDTTSWTKENAVQKVSDPEKIIIKPNLYSWSGMVIANAYQTSFNYKRDLESHMMKNTEWGAVAYLTNSLYGRCTKVNGQATCTEVTQNRNSESLTGYTYESGKYPNSTGASTTANRSGIYDMSGGNWESVMGIMANANGTLQFNTESGFTNENFPTEEKYYDKYLYNSHLQIYNKRILGDATGELGPFSSKNGTISSMYSDYAWFVCYNGIFFRRGGHVSTGSNDGLFAFYYMNGNMGVFRIVLAL